MFTQQTSVAESRPAVQDKSEFNLLNPTPRALTRGMSTDRPDTTESPITVDAGHFQFELSFVDYAYEKSDGVRTTTLSVVPSNIKIGLFNNTDIQFVLTPYVRETVDDNAGKNRSEGFSDDTQIRLKINLWGNDGPDPVFGETAFALMPFIKFPTGTDGLSNDHVEGGLIVPLAIALPGDFSVGLMAEIDVSTTTPPMITAFDLVHTATISHDIPGIDRLAGYIEYTGISPHDTAIHTRPSSAAA